MSEMHEHSNKTVVSAEGMKKLEEKLQYLTTVRRAEVAEQISIARGFGDLSENAEYDEAKNEQSLWKRKSSSWRMPSAPPSSSTTAMFPPIL